MTSYGADTPPLATNKQLTGKRQRLEKLAKAAETIEEIELISW